MYLTGLEVLVVSSSEVESSFAPVPKESSARDPTNLDYWKVVELERPDLKFWKHYEFQNLLIELVKGLIADKNILSRKLFQTFNSAFAPSQNISWQWQRKIVWRSA